MQKLNSLGRYIRQHVLRPQPVAALVLGAPPQRRGNILLLLHLHHGEIDAARILAELMDEEPHHTGVPVGRVRIAMDRGRRIEGLAHHDGIAGEANVRVLLGVVHVLVHVHQHVVAAGVVQQMLHGVVAIGAGVVSGRGSRVPGPGEYRLSRVTPAAPVLLEVTATAIGDFV